MKHYVMILTALFTFGVFLAGCGEVTINGEDGEKAKVNLKDLKDGKVNVDVEGKDGEKGSMNIETDEEGSSSMTIDSGDSKIETNTGKGTKLPEGFPSDFPIPDDAKLVMANTLTKDGQKTYSVHFKFKQDAESVYSAIKSYAEDKGMKINLEQKSESNGQQTYLLNAGSNDKEFFQLGIGQLEAKQANVTYGVPGK